MDKKYIHSFRCVKNRHKFSLEFDTPNNNEIPIKDIRCPICGSEVELDLSFLGEISSKPSRSIMAKYNAEASYEAYRMAAEAKKMQDEIDPEITITNDNGKKPIKVRKSLVEKLKEKTPEDYL